MYVDGVALLEIFEGDRCRVADSQRCHRIRTILDVWRQTDLCWGRWVLRNQRPDGHLLRRRIYR